MAPRTARRDVAIIAYAQEPSTPKFVGGNDIEILIGPINAAIARSGLTRGEIGFTTGGSNDFLVGQAFSFLRALDAVGVHPAKDDSHVEMDGAWALYEAWVRLQMGDVDAALVWGLGMTSMGTMDELLTLAHDPYYVAPLMPDPTSVAGLQARALIDAGRCTERDLAEIAAARQRAGAANPEVAWERTLDAEAILAEPYRSSPLRPSLCPPRTDGAAAVVLAVGDVARRVCERPAWIRGVAHRTDAYSLGVRDLTRSESARLAGEAAGVGGGRVDVAELHASYPHEELVLRDALGLDDAVRVNPSGGPLVADPVMATGLIRIGEAAAHILRGDADVAVGHAAAGSCLQNNLVTVLEARQ